MFASLLGTKTKAVRPASGAHRNYIVEETLQGIDDPFNARHLWEHAGAFMGNARGRLKTIIDAAAYSVGKRSRVFSHIVLMLPAEEVAHDRVVAKGQLCQGLVGELSELFQRDFAKRLDNGETPRFEVRPSVDLPPNSVRVRLGHGIYVATRSDLAQWRIDYSSDGAIWTTLADMVQGQRLMMLGGSSEMATTVIPHWPFGNETILRLINDADDGGVLGMDASPGGTLFIRHDDSLGLEVVEKGDARIYLRFSCLNSTEAVRVCESVKSHHGKHTPKKDEPPVEGGLRLEPVLRDDTIQPEMRCDADGEERALSESGAKTYLAAVPTDDEPSEGTFMPLRPVARHALSVVGIALQRVSAYREAISGLAFGFDKRGQVVPALENGFVIGFGVDSEDCVRVLTPAGSRPVALGEELPLPGFGAVHLAPVPAPLDNYYLGYCQLPDPVSENIGQGARFTMGRGQRFMQRLRLLSGKDFLQTERRVGGDHMGFSSRAVMIEVGNEGLIVTPTGRSPIFHLDEHLEFIEQVDPQRKPTYLVAAGHHLVAGHYVLRFEA